MAINVTQALRPDPVQLNLRETSANRAAERSAQAADTRRAERTERDQKDQAAIRERVKQNTEASRADARSNDEAAATQRREARQADQQADTERRDAQKTLGRNIDTTA